MFFLILVCSQWGMAGYKDQRFVRNAEVKAALAKCWEQKDLHPELTPMYDHATWAAIADTKTKNIKELFVFVPNLDKEYFFCGEFMLRITPTEEVNMLECVHLLCYDNTFDESKFKIEFIVHSSYLQTPLPNRFSELKELSEEAVTNMSNQSEPYFEYLQCLEVVPGEKALVQIREK
jgi:hypothetical protein